MDSSIQGQLTKYTGGTGGIRIDGTGVNTGNYFAIKALASTVVNSGTVSNIDNLVGATLPADSVVYGDFTIVKATGDYILYNNI